MSDRQANNRCMTMPSKPVISVGKGISPDVVGCWLHGIDERNEARLAL